MSIHFLASLILLHEAYRWLIDWLQHEDVTCAKLVPIIIVQNVVLILGLGSNLD